MDFRQHDTETNDGSFNAGSKGGENDDTDLTRREIEAHPLGIGSILEKTFGFLDLDSLKTARQVSPLWSAEGAKILITKCYVKMPSTLRAKKLSSESLEIERIKFKSFLSHKSKDASLIPNILIEDDADVKLLKSLEILTERVYSIKLNIALFSHHQLSNLLDLLPNLKRLTFQKDMGYNIQVVQLLTKVMSSKTKNKEQPRSPLVISRMVFESRTREEFEELDQLSDCDNIMIEKIVFPQKPLAEKEKRCLVNSVWWREFFTDSQLQTRVMNNITKFLSTSRNVLKILSLEPCEAYLPLLQFPQMTSLKRMELHFGGLLASTLSRYKFSPSFRFSENTPNLREIAISFAGGPRRNNNFFLNLFGNAEFAPSVNVLEYSDTDTSDFNIDPLFHIFPDIQVFEAKGTNFSRKMLNSLWTHGQNLQRLSIGLKIDQALDFDAIFTGFAPETVEKIKDGLELTPGVLEELDKLRVNPSILNLKALEHFTIHVDKLPKRFLAIAGKHGFNLLPKNPEIFVRVGKKASGPQFKWTKLAWEPIS